MTFFDTLKDENVKALFKALAPELYEYNGEPWDQFVEKLSFDQRLDVFTVALKVMKALGIPGWQEPMYLNRES